MPWYDFECQKCQNRFEVKGHFDAPTEIECPNCGGEAKRKILPVNISFGWRLTEASYIKGNPMKLERNI